MDHERERGGGREGQMEGGWEEIRQDVREGKTNAGRVESKCENEVQ